MKNPKVDEIDKCNQQWKHPKVIVKISGEMETTQETVMKSTNGFS